MTNLFAIAGHFVSYRWVSGPQNFLVILWNLLNTKKVVHQQKQNKSECFAGRTKFFCGPHVRHLWSSTCAPLNFLAKLVKRVAYLLRQWFPNFFEGDPNLSLVNSLRPKPQTAYEKNNDSMDDFWQHVAMFVFNVSNLTLFSITCRQTSRDNVENIQLRFGGVTMTACGQCVLGVNISVRVGVTNWGASLRKMRLNLQHPVGTKLALAIRLW